MKEKKIKESLKLASQKLHSKSAQPKSGQNTVKSNRLQMLITVVNRNKVDYYSDLIQSFGVNMQATAMAYGTADKKMLNILGLSDTEKAVIFSVIQEEMAPEALAAIDEKFNTIKDGKGIAYTVPLSSVIGVLTYGFLSNNRKVKEGKQ